MLRFRTMSICHLVYAWSLWNPRKEKCDTQIVKMQKRATETIPNFYNLNYSDRQNKLLCL